MDCIVLGISKSQTQLCNFHFRVSLSSPSRVQYWVHFNKYSIHILEKAMTPHSITLAWKIPWMDEPDRLQSMRSLGVRHDWATSLWLFTFMHWEGNGNPLQYSCLENPKDRGAWLVSVYGVAQSRTWLKWLSSSSSNTYTQYHLTYIVLY